MIDITIAVPVIIALVEAFKYAGLSSKLAPIVSVILGVAGFYFFGVDDLQVRLFEGLISGLTASGLYSGTKTLTK